MELLETMTITHINGIPKILGTYVYVDGSKMLKDRKKYLVKIGYSYNKATKRYEKRFKSGTLTTVTFTKK